LIKLRTQVFIQKRVALLKLNEIRSIIKNGGIFNKGGLLIKG
jgi:hypothetical protein